MRRVIREGSSATSRRGDRTRIVALVATFLLLTAGMVVSMPGLMSASATSGSSQSHPGGDGKDDGKDDGHQSGDDEGHDDGHHDGGDGSECQNDDGHQGDDDGDDDSSDDQSGGDSSDDHSGDDQSSDNSGGSTDNAILTSSVDGSSSDGSSSDGSSSDGSHDDGSSSDGSHDDGSDDGSHDDGHHDSHDDGSDDDGDDDCTPPTTAALTLNKVVVNDNGGSSTIADFILTATSSVGGVDVISGPDSSDDPEVGISADVPVSESYVLSESGPTGYDASPWVCSAGTLDGDTLTLAAGDVANCTITNDDTPPPPAPAVIHVQKSVDNFWGGTVAPAGFQLYIDGAPATQVDPHEVTPGVHVISELDRLGYVQTGIGCIDVATQAVVGDGGTVDLAAGQEVTCVVANAAIPAQLTVKKAVINDNGGNAVPGDFNLQIDGVTQTQGEPHDVKAGLHTVSEEPVDGYRLVALVCTDDANGQTLVYKNGITLALDQHATCTLTNDDDPIDLAITKSDDGLVQVAGGQNFDYTITVDNLGPRDANLGEPVTVTDQLPVGFDFVSYPTPSCTAAGQQLTCLVDPANLQVADGPFVITVTVKAHPDAASGTYTNMAYVDTADDPACLGTGCVPVCGTLSNNIACETTQLKRQAGITIDKVDNVTGAISPGATYSYFIKVGNSGPSTFLANLTMTDPLPAELFFVSVSAPSPWTCNNSNPVACTYGAVLQPGTFTPAVTITVQLDPAFTGTSIHNVATAVATVDAPGANLLSSQLVVDAPAADPGTVVTATDDETTVIVRNANLSIKKTVSQASATAGDQFNWILDITNNGPDLATNVVVSDTIPAAFEVIGTFPSAGLGCTNTANSVQCTAASLANGVTVSAVVQVRVLAAATPGAVTNTATVVTDSTDPDTGDNTSSASITVTTAGSQAPVPPTPTPPASGGSSVSLPRTGNGSLSGPLTLAGFLFIGGIFSLVIARRRRAATA